MSPRKSTFDAQAKERELQTEAQSWDVENVNPADHGDIPTIDLSAYFRDKSDTAPANTLDDIAKKLNHACTTVGFYYLVGHQLDPALIENVFTQTRRFHQLPLKIKTQIEMDQADWPITGVGYLPLNNRKLPHRITGNDNEAFLIKRNHQIQLSDNRWPPERILPNFRSTIEAYAQALSELANKLLPIYARALNMPANYFTEAFRQPFYRLRMTHYPARPDAAQDKFGISPHVDTTFFTILAQSDPGLSVFSEKRQTWIAVPAIDNALIVNTGELLKQWTNDVFLSAKHFANNNSPESARYSIPFFYNANTEFKMHCIPSCCSESRPARYPPISYSESQGVIQGE